MGSTVKEGAGIPQLNGTNYENWKFRVKLFLEAAEVSEVLTADAPAAEGEARNKFMKMDRKAKSLLVGFVGDECLGIVRDKDSARAMWTALEDTYAKKSVASQTLLRKQLARLRMKDGTSMRSHFQAFDELVRQLKSAGAKLEENDLVSQLFLTLPDSYDPLVTALENIDEKELTMDTVKQRLLGEESKRADRADNSCDEKSAAFVGGRGNKPKKFNGKCHRCGKIGHMQRDCRVKKSDANAVVGGKSVSFMVNQTETAVDHARAIFVVDSGCSDHLVNNRSYLHDVRKLKEPFVVDVAKNGVSLIGEYEGVVKGVSKQGVHFEMKNVVYLPELRGNLLSVKKMSKAGIDVLFTRDDGMEKAVMKHGGDVIAVAKLRRNLYELELELETDGGSANVCTSEVSSKWHRRLGHASQQAMDALVRYEMVNGLEPKPKRIGFCDTCVLGKQCREPFDGTRERATRPLERVHSDVCGPIDPPSWDGCRYFVSFIDDYTHFAVIQPIKKKSEVFERFKDYEAMATTHWEKKISKLTVDQGREYCSNEQRNYYKRKGIQLQSTVAYSPQQNGVAERFNRTLVEKVRTMLIDSNMPKRMWSEAALMGTYLLNRSPTSALDDHVTPAERWLKAKPDVGKLRIFGCQAFAWVPNQQRRKLDNKSREAVMVGYAPNGYRLWDQTSKKVFLSRDVKFNEDCFPFREDDTESNSPLVIPVRYQQEGEIEDNDAANVLESDSGDEEDDYGNDSDEESADEGAKGGSSNDPNPGALPSQQRRDDCKESTTRRSERERRLPGKFLDFFTGYRATSAGNISPLTDPPCAYNDIAGRDDRESWLEAVEDELTSLESNKVWKLVKRPVSCKPLKSKWVFRVKEDEHGNPVKFKARLVVKGFLQKPGMDYQETYAPVAKLSTIRTVLAVGVQQRCYFHQMDVKTAFLHGELREEIYMDIPDGVQAPPGMVCRLQRSLYGLKQSPRCWNDKFNDVLLKLGFVRSKHDYCLYTWRGEDGDSIFLVLYVDDLMIVGTKLETIQALKRKLSQIFDMTDCGTMSHFLGIKITYDRNAGTMQLSQGLNIEKILSKFGMADCNSTRTPMEKGLKLESKVDSRIAEPYRELLGSLMYIMMSTRPDICYPVGYLGRFQQQPGQPHWIALKRIVRYLKGSKDAELIIKRNHQPNPLVGYADADWATDTEDRKSVSGFLFKVYGNTVSWSSKKQTTVATSSSEAEYVALSSAATEAVWLTGILKDLGLKDIEPVTLFEDNRGCIGMAKNVECKRAKHIDIKHHFVRDHVAAGRLAIEPIPTLEQLADIFTKALDPSRFEDLRKKLGVYDREGVKTK